MRIGSRPGGPSAPTVISVVALFVALSSSATAAIVVTGRSVKNGSLTGADIKNRSIPPGKLTRGARVGLKGPLGDRGPAGDPGPGGAQGEPGGAGDSVGSATAPLVVGQIRLSSASETCTWENPAGYSTSPGEVPPSLRLPEPGVCRMTFGGYDRPARYAFAQAETAPQDETVWATVQVSSVSQTNPYPTVNVRLTDQNGPADGTAYVAVFAAGQ